MEQQTPIARGRSSQRGFTLLLAALVSSIVLALGAAIFEIAQKELTLSSIGRDSQFAFYAADSAAECALYWDFRCSYFATSTSEVNTSDPSCTSALTPGPTCDAQAMDITGRPTNSCSGSSCYPYTMQSTQVDFFKDASPTGAGYCVQVSVTKSWDPTASAVRTLIHADGYNVDCADISTAARALQRSVELHY